jgi:hypothetical protein
LIRRDTGRRLPRGHHSGVVSLQLHRESIATLATGINVHAGARDRPTIEKQASRARFGTNFQQNTRMTKPLCFVLMPFGKKPDADGRTIDFDAVYEQFIKPAIGTAGLESIRADEEVVGGIIHKPMFERLLLCEFAVADLTTANAFSDSTFGEFVFEKTGIDIHSSRYTNEGTSKAKKLRAFWKLEPDYTVGELLLALIDYSVALDPEPTSKAKALAEQCRRIATRLLAGGASLTELIRTR